MYHIKRLAKTSLLAIVAMVMVTAPALADKSKKRISRGRSAIPTEAIKYATPTIGAVEFIVNALGQQRVAAAPSNTSLKRETATVEVTQDTAVQASKIVKAHASSAGFTAKISLASDEQRIDIGIYNMLGKRMGDVYAGPATKGDHEYTASTEDLPEGVYICILQGSDFRRAAKFYLNR